LNETAIRLAKKAPHHSLWWLVLAAPTVSATSKAGLIAISDKLVVSGEVNRMIAAAINADPRWF